MEHVNKFVIPEAELEEKFARSSGAGGQNVNKRSTKVDLSWSFEMSSVLDDAQKLKLRERLAGRINEEGLLKISCSEERSQDQNRRLCVERLHALVNEALEDPAKRFATKPTRGSKERRLEGKTKRGQTKQARAKTDWE